MHSLFLYYLDLFSLMRVCPTVRDNVQAGPDGDCLYFCNIQSPASCQILRGSITQANLLLAICHQY